MYDKRVREDVLRVGEHVYLRNRVKGRNKTGEAWEPSEYIIKERKDDTSVVAPMTGHKRRVINRTDLRVCVPEIVRRAVAERESRYQTPRPGPNILHSDVESSDAESGRVEITISREPTINYSDSDSDQDQVVISLMPLRRSTRRKAGYPFRNPRAVLNNYTYFRRGLLHFKVGEDVTLVDLAVYIFVRLVTRGRYAQCHSQFNNLSEF